MIRPISTKRSQPRRPTEHYQHISSAETLGDEAKKTPNGSDIKDIKNVYQVVPGISDYILQCLIYFNTTAVVAKTEQ